MSQRNLERSPRTLSWIVGGLVWFIAGAFVLAMFLAVVAT